MADTEPSCPKCQTGTGLAFRVLVLKEQKQVTYRCACGHEWTVSKPTAATRQLF